MVRINLLPYKSLKERHDAVQYLLICVGVLAVLLGGLTLYYFNQIAKRDELNANIAFTKKETERFNKIAKQADELEKQLEVLKSKLEVIRELDRDRAGAFRLLTTTMDMVIKERMWLTSIGTEVKTPKRRRTPSRRGRGAPEEPEREPRPDVDITVRGIALDEKTIANFMANLEKHPLYKQVRLGIIQEIEIDQGQERDPLLLLRFEIMSQESPPEIQPAEEVAAKNGEEGA